MYTSTFLLFFTALHEVILKVDGLTADIWNDKVASVFHKHGTSSSTI